MRLRIGPRMIVGFLIMSAMLLIIGILTIRYINHMHERNLRIFTENVSSLKAAEELEIALLDMKGLTSYYLLDGEERWLNSFIEKHTSFLNWFEEARKGAQTIEEKQIITKIETLYQSYIKLQKQSIDLYKKGKKQQSYQVLINEMRYTFLLIYEQCEEYLKINEELMQKANQQIEEENETARKIVYTIAGIGIVLGILLGVLLARSITSPIYRLALKVKDATNGEFVEKIDFQNDTELDYLNRHVRELIDKIYEVNKDLEQKRRMLIQSEKLAALGQVAAGVAHEIYNPLAAIKILLFSLQQGLILDSQKSKDFEVITKEITRIENFVQHFLQFARPQESHKSTIPLNKLIDDCLSLLSPQFSNEKIRMEKSLITPEPIIFADEEQIKQVLVNILLNALQAMPESGSLKIETRLNKSNSEINTILQIIVSDTGTGIPREILKYLFDPFRTTKSKGTGLGLSIAYQIIQNHGGWIEASNNFDKGATFNINLPVQGEK